MRAARLPGLSCKTLSGESSSALRRHFFLASFFSEAVFEWLGASYPVWIWPIGASEQGYSVCLVVRTQRLSRRWTAAIV